MSAFRSFLNVQAKFLCIMSEIEFLNFYSETRQNETSENGGCNSPVPPVV